MALAGIVIASHYAEPLDRRLTADATLLGAPDNDSQPLADLPGGTALRILDISRGWAWGYAAGQVGYLPASLVG